jgi:hypothetical protein
MSMRPATPDDSWLDPTDIGKANAPALKIAPGPVLEGCMSNVDRPAKRKPLTLTEVREAYESLGEKYPPLLSLSLAAEISGYTELTLKKKLSEGAFRDAVSRGKPLLFWRDRFVMELMNRPWSPPARMVPQDDHQQQGDGGDDEVH